MHDRHAFATFTAGALAIWLGTAAVLTGSRGLGEPLLALGSVACASAIWLGVFT